MHHTASRASPKSTRSLRRGRRRALPASSAACAQLTVHQSLSWRGASSSLARRLRGGGSQRAHRNAHRALPLRPRPHRRELQRHRSAAQTQARTEPAAGAARLPPTTFALFRALPQQQDGRRRRRAHLRQAHLRATRSSESGACIARARSAITGRPPASSPRGAPPRKLSHAPTDAATARAASPTKARRANFCCARTRRRELRCVGALFERAAGDAARSEPRNGAG